MTSLSGKIAIVTGGASGIGYALSEALTRQGAEVVLADLNAGLGQAAAERLRAHWARCDVTEPSEVAQLIDDTLRRSGRIDCLFNNAGLAPSGDLREFGLSDWRKLVDVNLNAVVAGSRLAYPHMARQGSGHIVNTASLGGLIPAPTMALYTATKHAVVGFSLALRAEARPHGVKVSAACPAFVASNIRQTTRALLGPHAVHPRHDSLIARISAADCARAIVRGALRDQAVIVTPWYAGLAWRLYRWFPGIFDRLIFPLLLRAPRTPAEAS